MKSSDARGQQVRCTHKVGFPRSDLHVSVHGLAIKPGLALGSWAAFLGTDFDNAMVMGDLVLLEGRGESRDREIAVVRL